MVKEKWRKVLAVQDMFVAEEPGFAVKAGSVSCETAVGADNAVAGDDECDGIVSDSAADRLRGHSSPGFWVRNAVVGQRQHGSNLTVGQGLSEWNREQNLPDRPAEWGSQRLERRDEIGRNTAEIGIKPADRLLEDRQFACDQCLCWLKGGG